MRAFFTTVLVVLVCHGAARADNSPLWGASAATCVPGDPAIDAQLYLVTAGSVKFKDGASGLITLYCPIHTILGANGFAAPDVLRLTYLDSDGKGSDAEIVAQVVALSKKDGALSNVVGATVDSDRNPSPVTTATSLISSPFKVAFDFVNSYYYVRVDLTRGAKASSTAILYGVAIESPE